jgi:energy-coupling factor transporter ATP-binding protein EcfA2
MRPLTPARGDPFRFAEPIETRLLHTLIVGKTGSGKSTLLRELCVADAHAGRGFLLVDPHGDLAHDLLRRIPRFRKNDLVHFNPTDPATCPGLNPLRMVEPERRPLVVSNILAAIRKLWGPEAWGPRTEHVLRHALLALMDVRGATLADARAMLTDDKRRRSILKQVKDDHVLAFWTQEFTGYGKQFGAEVTAPILNKLGALLASGPVRTVVTKTKPWLDARRLMDRSAIVIASLPKGRIGEDSTLILGGLLIGAFQAAAYGRVEIPCAERSPFFLIIDEVGSFATRPLLELVADARKFATGLVLATQSLAVLEPPVRAALLGNVGTLISFRLGAEDAEIVEREFVHEFRAEHLMRLEVGEMVMRSGVKRPVVIPRRNEILRSMPLGPRE